MTQNGRIVNISSVGSSLNGWSPALQKRIRNPKMTLPELNAFVQEYLVSRSPHIWVWHSQWYGRLVSMMTRLRSINMAILGTPIE